MVFHRMLRVQFILASLAIHVVAQSVHFEQAGREQGLSQDTALCLDQDRDGFLWVGTQDGLNRFDGYRFRTYRHDPRDPTSIPDNFIWSVVADDDGYLWIGTTGGLCRLDLEAERFQSIPMPERPPGRSRAVHSLTILKNDLLAGTDHGLYRVDRATMSCEPLPWATPLELGPGVIRVMLPEPPALWIGRGHWRTLVSDGGGLARLDLNKKTSTPMEFRGLEEVEPQVSAVVRRRDGSLWVGCYGQGLFRQRADRAFERVAGFAHLGSAATISDMLEDRSGVLWIATDGAGVFRQEREADRILPVPRDLPDHHGLSDAECTRLFQDHFDGVWVGTWNRGLNRTDRSSSSFHVYRSHPDGKGLLRGNRVMDMLSSPDGTLWLAAWDKGLHKLDLGRHQSEVYMHDPNDDTSCPPIIRQLARTEDGKLFVGTRDRGVVRFDPQRGVFEPFASPMHPRRPLTHAHVLNLTLDTDHGTLWVGTRGGGLNGIDLNTDQVLRLPHQEKLNAGLSDKAVYAVRRFGDWLIIATSAGGLNRYHLKTEETKVFRHDDTDSSLGHDGISALLLDSSGVMWVGTAGGGLNHIPIETLCGPGPYRFGRITVADGLGSDAIGGILEDERGHIWVSTVSGISRIHAQTLECESYFPRDGVQDQGYYIASHYKAPNGTFFFGGPDGLTAFNPAQVQKNTIPPQVWITEFLLFNEPVRPESGRPDARLTRPIRFTSELHLTHRDTVMSLDFVGLHFKAPEAHRYAYLLEGIDPDWVTTDHTQRRATYTTLPPGQYTFRVKACNTDGVWSSAHTGLNIEVHPPFWKTWWAVAIYLATAVLVAVGIHAWRVRELAQREAHLSHLVHARTRELRDVNHSLETRNTELADINRELTTLDEIVQTINRETDLESLLNTLLDKAHTLCPQAEKGGFLVWDAREEAFRCAAFFGYSDVTALRTLRLTQDEVIGRYTHASDDLGDGVYLLHLLHFDALPAHAKLGQFGVPRATLAMSLEIKNQLAGFLVLDNYAQSDAFTEENVVRLKRLRGHALSAVAKATTFEELMETAARLRNTRRELLRAAHVAGMAEIASNVIHHVGNTLNTVNISAQLVHQKLEDDKVLKTSEPVLSDLLEHAEDLASYFLEHPRSAMIPKALHAIFQAIATQHRNLADELKEMCLQIERIKRILASQQEFAHQGEAEEQLSLSQIILDVLMLHENEFREKQIHYETQLDEEASCHSRRHKLVHILEILIMNACDAMVTVERDRKLFILLERQGEQVRIVVQDNGRGMGPDTLSGVFSQQHRETARSGFGLHYCANTVSEMGGHIEAHSLGRNQGTTIEIRLPVTGNTALRRAKSGKS